MIERLYHHGPVACGTIAYLGSPVERALSGIAAAGYRYVELAAMPGYCDHLVGGNETEAETISRTTRVLKQTGLELVSLAAHVDLIPARPEHLPALPGELACELLLARVRIASALGAPVVTTQGANPGSAETADLHAARLEPILEECHRLGIKLALEWETGITASLERFERLRAKLDGAPLYVNFDTGNVRYYLGRDPTEEFLAIHRHVAHIHLKDHRGATGNDGEPGAYDFPPLGEGTVDFAGFVETLRTTDYQGPLSMEIEFEDPVRRPDVDVIDRAAGTSITFLNSLLRAE